MATFPMFPSLAGKINLGNNIDMKIHLYTEFFYFIPPGQPHNSYLYHKKPLACFENLTVKPNHNEIKHLIHYTIVSQLLVLQDICT